MQALAQGVCDALGVTDWGSRQALEVTKDQPSVGPAVEAVKGVELVGQRLDDSERSPDQRSASGLRTWSRRARIWAIRGIDLLWNNALSAKPASVSKKRRTTLGEVFVEQQARLAIAQWERQRQ
jgi:hypothetical protein